MITTHVDNSRRWCISITVCLFVLCDYRGTDIESLHDFPFSAGLGAWGQALSIDPQHVVNTVNYSMFVDASVSSS